MNVLFVCALQDSAVLSVMEETFDSVAQFNLVRSGGTFSRVAVSWSASSSVADLQSDITPTSGVVSNTILTVSYVSLV